MIDYTKGKNLAIDSITDNVCVSTAIVPKHSIYGNKENVLIETWIFSGDKKQKSRLIFHKNIKQALKVHRYIVNNLLAKMK